MAESLIAAFRVTVGRSHPIEAVELLPSVGGVFDVYIGETRVFSKFEAGRFPSAGEIEAAVRARLP